MLQRAASGAGVVLVLGLLTGCGGSTATTSASAAVKTSGGSATSASIPQAPAGVPQQCVAVEGLLTNATSVLSSGGDINSAADLKTRFATYGAQLQSAAAGGPAKLEANVATFIAALDTYARDAQTGTPPPANLLGDAANALSVACTP